MRGEAGCGTSLWVMVTGRAGTWRLKYCSSMGLKKVNSNSGVLVMVSFSGMRTYSKVFFPLKSTPSVELKVAFGG